MQPIHSGDHAALRRFALVLAAFLGVAFGVIAPWVFDRPWPAWPWFAAAALAALGLGWPRGVYPLYRVLAPVLRGLAAVNNWLLLGAVYFLVVWPYGLLARATRRLHYVTGFDRGVETYRVTRQGPPRRDGPTDLDEPF